MSGLPGEAKPSKIEEIKRGSRHLRGLIAQELRNGKAFFTEESIQLLKFHGMYQQDDRDLRQQLKKAGKEKAYSMMIRARIPGGMMSPEAYLQFDRLADLYGNHSLRITTRQTFQMHGILKHDIKETIRAINDALITTLGGCGDQVRNILLCPAPHQGPFYAELRSHLAQLVDVLSAKTAAYHEIWLDGENVSPPQEPIEPLYGETYLPRKFKLALVEEGDNCVDLYANDVGIVAHRDGDIVAGYTILVGGGMGRNATKEDTYPRLAEPLAFVRPDELVETIVAIVTTYRDHGNRSDRQHGRFKYLLDARGLAWLQKEVEHRLGRALQPPRSLSWEKTSDHLGWHSQGDGRYYLGIHVQNGRLRDSKDLHLKTALREIIETYRPQVHLTTSQNILLCHLDSGARTDIEARLRLYGVKLLDDISNTVRHAMACPALPTCGLAITESERVMPTVLSRFEAIFGELGLTDEQITIRMTGCPNGCARPYVSDIGFVGRAPGKYDVYLGGDFYGTRLNTIFSEAVALDDLAEVMYPVLSAFQTERQENERFSDYCQRVGMVRLREVAGVLA